MDLPDPEWRLVRPDRPTGTGVVLAAGSSGRVDVDRARVLADGGATVLAIRWFGGPGQPAGPYGVPLETFVGALDLLAPECDRLALVGTSFGAEASLLVSAVDHRVAAVAAFAPSAYVWGGHDGDRWTSHWTWQGEPLPYLPFVEDWVPASDPPAFLAFYARSVAAAAPVVVDDATIPVERIRGSVLLVAGGDDQVCPSVDFARVVADRRAAAGLATDVLTHPDAGHRTLLPGETVVAGGQQMLRGGTEDADRALGELAWRAIREAVVRSP